MTIGSIIRHSTRILLGAAVLLLSHALLKPAEAACTNPAAGAGVMRYNSSQKVFQYCNDTNWIGVNKPGTGTGGCSNPTLKEGGIVYNTDGRVLQGCAGSIHRAFGPVGGGAKWVKVSTSLLNGCGISSSGTLMCWGGNFNSQLGDGGYVASAVPKPVAGSHRWIDVAVGEKHACGVRENNTLWCWGERYGGKIGDGGVTTGNASVMAQVSGTWKKVAAGEDTTCGIKTDDTLWCWGARDYGRVGDGGATTGTQTSPVQISGGGVWRKVALGYGHGCAIKLDNTAWCWGNAANGKTARGNTTDSNVPTAVFAGADTWLDIDTGEEHTCGIKSNGTAWCWGLGTGGQLGSGALSSSMTAVTLSGGGTWKSIEAGPTATSLPQHSCAVKSDDTLWCWGDNSNGQLGDGTILNSAAPVQVSGGGTWASVAVGDLFTCGIRANGARNCWGRNGANALLGTGAREYNPVPTPISVPKPWKYVATGNVHACGIKADDTLWCWGNNSWGQLGIGNTRDTYTPTQVSGGGAWRMVTSQGDDFTCGIKTDNTAWCWGNNGNGYLGTGNNTASNIPVAVTGGGTWKMIDSGNVHSCGIKSDDRAYCWGSNGSGRLGDGTTTARNAPTLVQGGADTWLSVAAGSASSCGIKADGTGWCWGDPGNGRLGNNDATTAQPLPAAINGGGTWKSIEVANGTYACGIKSDGLGYCWGANTNGRLGDGTTIQRLVPTAISGGALWKDIQPGSYSACGIQQDDKMYCWGLDSYGGLGQNTLNVPSSVPLQIYGGGTWKMVRTGAYVFCAIGRDDQGLYCWGWNIYGQQTNTEFSMYTSNEPTSPASSVCLTPKGKPGELKFNSASNLMQYCDGSGWVSMGGTAPNKVSVSSGLVGHWRFSEGTGTTTADASGYNNTLTLTNMVAGNWVAGKFETGIDFAGTDDKLVGGASPHLNNLGPLTVCMWIYPRTHGAGVSGELIDKLNGAGDAFSSWSFFLTNQTGLGFYSRRQDIIQGGTFLVLNSWQHVCVSWDGTKYSGANTTAGIKFYRNGTPVLTGVSAVDTGSAVIDDSPYTLRFGSNPPGDDSPYNGRMDDVRIYNRVLSLEEIQFLAGQ